MKAKKSYYGERMTTSKGIEKRKYKRRMGNKQNQYKNGTKKAEIYVMRSYCDGI